MWAFVWEVRVGSSFWEGWGREVSLEKTCLGDREPPAVRGVLAWCFGDEASSRPLSS